MKFSPDQEKLLNIVKQRFEKRIDLHPNTNWDHILTLIKKDTLDVISIMEETGGAPNIVEFEPNQFWVVDCSEETPINRRSLCYDKAAWNTRKENKPIGNVMDWVKSNHLELLSEADYRHLQSIIDIDLKTSSWLLTPENIRKLGGAIFGDKRYSTTFIYHNGASSYYASRGFRTKYKL
jgi:hypothetical protein